MKHLIALGVLGLTLVGCASLESKVPGSYRLEAVAKEEKDRVGTSIANGFLGAMVFELKPDHSLTGGVGGIGASGKWSLSGDKITITLPGDSDPLIATVSSDGRILTPVDKEGKTPVRFVKIDK
jgi:hypothetical protein